MSNASLTADQGRRLLALRKKHGKMRIHRLEAGVLGWRLGAVGVGLGFKGGA